MLESRGSHLAAGARRVAAISLGLMIIGPSILLVYAWVEVLNNPGLTLSDGYWIGRTPWTPLGIAVALLGGMTGLLSGSVAIAIEGGWWRRALVPPACAAASLWWVTALGVLPLVPRFRGPDPVTFAYTLPVTATLLVLMPAALLAVICLTPRGHTPARTRLRPVPPRETWSGPTDAGSAGPG
jgi:hypothetical protein